METATKNCPLCERPLTEHLRSSLITKHTWSTLVKEVYRCELSGESWEEVSLQYFEPAKGRIVNLPITSGETLWSENG